LFQVEDAVDPGEVERVGGQVDPLDQERCRVLLLHGPVVVVGEAVDRNHFVTPGEQRLRQVRPDEPSGSGDDVPRHRAETIRGAMVDAMRSSASGRELAALGRTDGALAMLPASVTARPCEAPGSQSPALPGWASRKRPGRARPRIRAREIMASAI
jgi:hypothetical protein